MGKEPTLFDECLRHDRLRAIVVFLLSVLRVRAESRVEHDRYSSDLKIGDLLDALELKKPLSLREPFLRLPVVLSLADLVLLARFPNVLSRREALPECLADASEKLFETLVNLDAFALFRGRLFLSLLFLRSNLLLALLLF